MLIVDAERYPDLQRVDVRVRDGRIAAVAARLEREPEERVLNAAGAVLLPGLHDHHLHLFALAARSNSVACGPPHVTSAAELEDALRRQPGQGWVRGVGYHESVAGPLDRWRLDAMLAQRPVRIEHASGVMWFVNSAAVRALGLAEHAEPGIERASGEPNGRLFRLDGWLRRQLGRQDPPDVAAASAQLAACGVTGITDTTPSNDDAAFTAFAAAIDRGALRQRLRLMGGEALTPRRHGEALVTGELKVMLDEYALPDLDELIARMRRAHQAGRGVAFHCVTRVELIFALRALIDAGSGPGDRIEHASVTPDDAFPLMRQCGVTVVTQPGLIAERGDRYLADVAADEHALLYRLDSFRRQGVPLAFSTDAPYGSADPWLAMRAAVTRRTFGGAEIGAGERLTAEAALAGFLTTGDAPGGAPRRIAPHVAADLCLLDRSWRDARRDLDAAMVTLTMAAGSITYERQR